MSDATPEIPQPQITPAHVLQVIQEEVIPRLTQVETKTDQSYQILKSAGILNGKGDELIQIVRDWRASQVREAAWTTVRADLKHRFRFLAPGKHWLTVLASAVIGGIGWQLASGALHIPHIH